MSKPVLFSSFRPLERAENIKAIYDAYDGEKIHRQTTARFPDSDNYSVIVTDDFPALSDPKKTIMIWHGIQGGKTIGLDQPGRPYYNTNYVSNMTYIISASHDMVDVWSKCTGVPKERILPLGMPRTDQYIGKKKGDGCTILAGKRAYLYVPTFRDRGEGRLPDIDWEYIDNRLTDNELFAIKYHPWHTGRVRSTLDTGKYRHIIELSPEAPTTPYLYDADVVITDYSSIMFDAYLLGKPVVLFTKNYDYISDRGMYFSYPKEYCSAIAHTEDGMIHLLHYENLTITRIERECIRRVADMCDGHACERLVNLINHMSGGD